jgi:tetratricopeptide (TPR) repeat protein
MAIERPALIKDIAGDWRTVYPKETEKYFDDYWEAVEIMDSNPVRAEQIFKKIISKCGEGHIDAILHLGFLYNDTGKNVAGEAMIRKAHAVIVQIIPETFDLDNERIPWGWLENRPLLRTFHAIGLEFMKKNQYGKAIEKFEFVLKVNPSDNQGVRYLMADCFFYLNKYDKFFELDKLYSDDHTVDFLYGKLLALLKTNKIDEAKKQFDTARNAFPHVASELIKKKHSFPHNEFDQPLYGVPVGSWQEAFLYGIGQKNFGLATRRF